MVQEGQFLAVFNSAHRVMKAEKLLKSVQLPILLIPAPREISTDCGLALRFDPDFANEILDTLHNHNLMPEFITKLEQQKYTTVWHNGDSLPHL